MKIDNYQAYLNVLKKIIADPHFQPNATNKELLNLVRDKNGNARHFPRKNALALQPSDIRPPLSSQGTPTGAVFEIKIALYDCLDSDDEYSTWHINDNMIIFLNFNGESSIHDKSLAEQKDFDHPLKNPSEPNKNLSVEYFLGCSSLYIEKSKKRQPTGQATILKRPKFKSIFFRDFSLYGKFAEACKRIESDQNYNPGTTDEEMLAFVRNEVGNIRDTLEDVARIKKAARYCIHRVYAPQLDDKGNFHVVYQVRKVAPEYDNKATEPWRIDDYIVIVVNMKGEYSIHYKLEVERGNLNRPLKVPAEYYLAGNPLPISYKPEEQTIQSSGQLLR